jgi:hypothetical protein
MLTPGTHLAHGGVELHVAATRIIPNLADGGVLADAAVNVEFVGGARLLALGALVLAGGTVSARGLGEHIIEGFTGTILAVAFGGATIFLGVLASAAGEAELGGRGIGTLARVVTGRTVAEGGPNERSV